MATNNDKLYDNISDYNASLIQAFESKETNKTGLSDRSCTLTFKMTASFDLSFLQMPNSPSPINFKFFNKLEQAGEVISDINNIFIKQIEDLECCSLSDKYNDNIVPLFMYIIGDAGNPNSSNYGEWRKDSGLFPILIKTIREILKGFEILKNITCIIRPVPGNPWAKQAGTDFFKPIYGPLNTMELIINSFLDGEFLDIILNPLIDFRNVMMVCSGVKNKLKFLNEDDLRTLEYSTKYTSLTSAISDYNNLKSNPIKVPTYTETYKQNLNIKYSIIEKLKNIQNLYNLNKTKYETTLSNITAYRIRYNKIESSKQILENDKQSIELKSPLTKSDSEKVTELEKSINFLNNILISLTEAIFLLESNLIDYEKNLKEHSNNQNEINKDLININKKLEEEKTIYDKAYKAYLDYIKKLNELEVLRSDCSLQTKIELNNIVKHSGACNCILDFLNINVPLPEFVSLQKRSDLEKIYGRLPYTIKDIKDYSSKTYKVLKESDIFNNDRFGTSFISPYLILLDNYEIKDENIKNLYSSIIQEIKNVTKISEAILISDKLIKVKQTYNFDYNTFTSNLNTKQNELIIDLKKLKNNHLKRINQLKKLNNTTQFNNLNSNISMIEILISNTNIIENIINYILMNTLKIEDKTDLITAEAIKLNLNNQEDKNLIQNTLNEYLLELNKYETSILYLEEIIKTVDNLLFYNTRTITIISKENIPCDCSLICKVLQYFIDMIMKQINNMIQALIQKLVSGLMTKELAYIIKFIKAKLQCALDIANFSNNIEKINNEAKNSINELQGLIQEMNEPIFCTDNDEINKIELNPTTIKNIKDSLINFNFSESDSGEQILDENGNTITTSEKSLFQYPNTISSINSTYINSNQVNNNYVVIENVKPGRQFELRNIPTLEFNCDIEDETLQPTFDIFIDEIPEQWSIYFSFKLDDKKLNFVSNTIIETPKEDLKTEANKIINELLETPNLITIPNDSLNVDSYIEKANDIIANYDMNKKIEECTPEELAESSINNSCSIDDLNILNIELIKTNNTNNVNFIYDNINESITLGLKDLNISNFVLRIPIKITAEKIVNDLSTIYDEDFPKEKVTTILLIDIYSLTDINQNVIELEPYNLKPEYDPNILFGRFPFLEIGYKNTDDQKFYINELVYDNLNIDIIKELCKKAITSKSQIDNSKFLPTPEEIAAQKEKLENQKPAPECINDTSNGLTPNVNNLLKNNEELIKDNIIPELEKVLIQSEKTIEVMFDQTVIPPTDNDKVLIIDNIIKTEFGIPLLELNKEKNICVQIIKVNMGTIDNPDYKYRINISNFSLISNFVNLQNLNLTDTLPIDIIANQTYFLSISFDGNIYSFDLIGEDKIKYNISKLGIDKLFPTRFGRMSDPRLKDNTFCGTLFDLGITNTKIIPEVYYKFSLLNFKPKTNIFIPFEYNIFNKFYSVNDLGNEALEKSELSSTVKNYIESEFLKNNYNTELPFYIFNKYINIEPIFNNIEIFTNNFVTVSRNNYITNFFCKESIKNKSFTLSFWFKKASYENIDLNSKTNVLREVIISDTMNFNTLYYDEIENKFIFEYMGINKKETIDFFYNIIDGDWYNLIFRFNHISNELILFIGNEHEETLIKFIIPLVKQFNFNLISICSEFDFIFKDFRNYFLCDFGNLIIDQNVLSEIKLNEMFLDQKLCFRGC